MWILFIAFMFLGGIAAIIYLVTRFHNFSFIKKMANRKLSWLVASVPVALIACFSFYDIFAMIVIMLHLIIAFLLSDLIGWIIRR